MKTAADAIAFIDAHSRNLLLTRDGHAALINILQEANRQATEAAKEEEAGGPG
jgi:hypothetical protein